MTINRRTAFFKSQLKTRSENNTKIIEGYFAVYNQPTELWQDCFEEIAPGAFDDYIDGDIRCLFNHDSGFVLGRTTSKTLELRSDSYGLWGKVAINENDSQALDVYARVERGDISGCSFGFSPIKETWTDREDGTTLWREEKVELYEVSVCTFPAYPQTEIAARQKEFEASQKREIQRQKEELKQKLEGIRC